MRADRPDDAAERVAVDDRERPLAICLDFDGTIVRPDTIRLLAELGMGPLRARRLARDADLGRVTIRDAIEEMVGSVTATREIGMRFLSARARLDPGFRPLLSWAERQGLPVYVLSAGLEPVVRHFLGSLVDRVRIVANDLVVEAHGPGYRWRAVFRGPGAAEGEKRRVVEQLLADRYRVAYAGDGRGDLPAATLVAGEGRATGSRVFARDTLAAALRDAGLAWTPFETLDDVRRALAGE